MADHPARHDAPQLWGSVSLATGAVPAAASAPRGAASSSCTAERAELVPGGGALPLPSGGIALGSLATAVRRPEPCDVSIRSQGVDTGLHASRRAVTPGSVKVHAGASASAVPSLQTCSSAPLTVVAAVVAGASTPPWPTDIVSRALPSPRATIAASDGRDVAACRRYGASLFASGVGAAFTSLGPPSSLAPSPGPLTLAAQQRQNSKPTAIEEVVLLPMHSSTAEEAEEAADGELAEAAAAALAVKVEAAARDAEEDAAAESKAIEVEELEEAVGKEGAVPPSGRPTPSPDEVPMWRPLSVRARPTVASASAVAQRASPATPPATFGSTAGAPDAAAGPSAAPSAPSARRGVDVVDCAPPRLGPLSPSVATAPSDGGDALVSGMPPLVVVSDEKMPRSPEKSPRSPKSPEYLGATPTLDGMGWTPSFHNLAPMIAASLDCAEGGPTSPSSADATAAWPYTSPTAAAAAAAAAGAAAQRREEDEQSALELAAEEGQRSAEELAELKVAVANEALERQRLESLVGKTADRLSGNEAFVANLAKDLEEAKTQRDQMRKQMQDTADKQNGLLRKLRQHQEANRDLENDLAQALSDQQEADAYRKQAEAFAKKLQQKLQSLESNMAALTAAHADPRESQGYLEEQLERLRRQLEDTVRAVQARREPDDSPARGSLATEDCESSRRSSGGGVMSDLTELIGGARGSRHRLRASSAGSSFLLAPPLHQSPEAKQEQAASLATTSDAGHEETSATEEEEEEELPTAQEQLLSEWSSTSLQAVSSPLPLSFAQRSAPAIARTPPPRLDFEGGEASASSLLPSPLADPSPQQLGSPGASTDAPQRERTPSAASGAAAALSLRDLSEIKALKKPPPPVRMLMEVCCLLFHIQPVRQADDRAAKRWRLDYWEPARRYLLSDPFFVSKLKLYDQEIKPAERAKLNRYFQDPDFTAERVRSCSKAAAELYDWVLQVVASRDRARTLIASLPGSNVGAAREGHRERSPGRAA